MKQEHNTLRREISFLTSKNNEGGDGRGMPNVQSEEKTTWISVDGTIILK
jgi:hypothetical protein